MHSVSRLYFRPGQGELIETVIRPAPEDQCAIHGTVVDARGIPMANALVLLYDSGQETPQVLSSCFTGEDGTFAFGPLVPGRLHFLQIYQRDLRLRALERTPESPAQDTPPSSSPV